MVGGYSKYISWEGGRNVPFRRATRASIAAHFAPYPFLRTKEIGRNTYTRAPGPGYRRIFRSTHLFQFSPYFKNKNKRRIKKIYKAPCVGKFLGLMVILQNWTCTAMRKYSTRGCEMTFKPFNFETYPKHETDDVERERERGGEIG